jgi:hypothetical protein
MAEPCARPPHTVGYPRRRLGPVHQHVHARERLALGIKHDLEIFEQHRPGDVTKGCCLGEGKNLRRSRRDLVPVGVADQIGPSSNGTAYKAKSTRGPTDAHGDRRL